MEWVDMRTSKVTNSHRSGGKATLQLTRSYPILARCMRRAVQVRSAAGYARGTVEIGTQCPLFDTH